ncbi:MAG: GAF domain-containing protein [Vibrio gallaecicus]
MFNRIKRYRKALEQRLDFIAEKHDLFAVLIMESKPTSMEVFASNQQDVYKHGDAGYKSVVEFCKELYCERVVNQRASLLVLDAANDDEWSENEDLVKFGLGVYYGIPLFYKDEVVGTVCTLNKVIYDFDAGTPSAREELDELALYIQNLIKPDRANHTHQSKISIIEKSD